MDIKYILGPTLIKCYEGTFSNGEKRKIYLFGEKHVGKKHKVKKAICDIEEDEWDYVLEIQHFLEELFLNASEDKQIDFYLEASFPQAWAGSNKSEDKTKENKSLRTKEGLKPDKKSKSYIKRIRDYFNDCFQIKKDKCRYPNVRFHYVDVRRLPFMKILKKSPECYKYVDIKKLVEKTKIQKQLDNIKDKNIKEKLTEIIGKEMKMLDGEIRKELEGKLSEDNLDPDRELIDILRIYFMDAYTIARIFRSFSDGEQKNIIVYTGTAHTRNYSYMLSKLGMRVSEYINDEGNNCVNISNISIKF